MSDYFRDFLAIMGAFTTIALICICVELWIDNKQQAEKKEVTVKMRTPDGEMKTLEFHQIPADEVLFIDITEVDRKHYEVSSENATIIYKEKK